MAEAEILDLFIEGFRPADLDLESDLGAEVDSLVITLLEAGNTPFDELTGATARFRVKRKYPSSFVLMELTESDGIDIDDVAGTLTITFTLAHFVEFRLNKIEQDFVYDLDLYDSNLKLWRLYKGDFTLGGDV